MNFCTECGKALSENSSFCTECGSSQAQAQKPQTEKSVEAPKAAKKSLSRKQKISFIASGVVVACLISAHFIITSMIDPMNKVQAMDRAMSEGKTEAFLKEIHIDQTALINKEGYFQYIKENGWEDLRYQLVGIADSDDKFDTSVRDENGNQVFVVKKNAFVPGLYYTYEIDAIPSNLNVSSNIPNTTLTIDKQSSEVKEADEEISFGKAYPGKFEITGRASNDFGEFKHKEKINVKSQEDEPIYFPIELEGSVHIFYTNIPESTLFINGKSTKKTLSEFDMLGPFPVDQDVELHAEWKDDKGKTHKTESINQDGDTWGTLNFEFNVDDAVVASTTENSDADPIGESEAAQNHVLDFRVAYEDALNTRDYGIVAPFLLKQSAADKELKKYIGDLQDKGYSYEFTDNTVTDIEDMGDNTFTVSTNEIFIFTNHLNEQTHYDREKTYTVIKNEDGFKIKKISIKDTDRNDM
ncbi:TcaA NTF2-like domain-containing protein [Guptibacillus hwajinpoensis]|uniref:TcaA NTF2-like domain-containing protein n=1 Tax=Guptibacillus hwajinpoensis TaxID=208199 RepID=UPI001CFD1CE9|nr:zinc-ribbon domain-containing protein [Pseudalkalibacillus hwajinpoensis]WLR61539.1 zinc-ribbon domain-containing protein [Pseudalkalibacillus hwajinpoensis]